MRLRDKMEKEKFKFLLQEANLTKKELASILQINIGSLNNWGSSQNIPYWVESWLENYIKAKELDTIVNAIKKQL